MIPSNSLALKISGSDAEKFLQGQITCDVYALKTGQNTLGAYCSIKGKLQSLFRLFKSDDGFFMQMQADLLQPTLNELQKYAVFSKVTLALVEHDLPHTEDKQAIENKIPELYATTVDTFFPHDLNLPALGAVSFTKGCYRGQEIVARMQHRGNLKRSMYLFNTFGTTKPADVVTNSDGAVAGTIVRVASTDQHTIGLAVITDALKEQRLFINGSELSLN